MHFVAFFIKKNHKNLRITAVWAENWIREFQSISGERYVSQHSVYTSMKI